MIKRLLFTLLLFPFFTFAQTRFENNAKETVQKMTTALSLEKDDAAKIYKLLLDKNIKIADVRKAGANDINEVKPKVATLNKECEKSIELIIGKEKFEKWVLFQKEEKTKKTTQ